jgi:hypothetical protein
MLDGNLICLLVCLWHLSPIAVHMPVEKFCASAGQRSVVMARITSRALFTSLDFMVALLHSDDSLAWHPRFAMVIAS